MNRQAQPSQWPQIIAGGPEHALCHDSGQSEAIAQLEPGPSGKPAGELSRSLKALEAASSRSSQAPGPPTLLPQVGLSNSKGSGEPTGGPQR